MRALRCLKPGDVQLVEVPTPNLPADYLLVSPTATGICGTDLEIIAGGVDPAFITYPITLGHEWTGNIVELGRDVKNFSVGDRVVVEGMIPCGKCNECVAGATNLCKTYDEIGFTRDGAAAEFIAVPAALAHAIADFVTEESAALVEPAAVVLQGMKRLAPKANGRFLVLGDGTIGLLAVALLAEFTPAMIDVFGMRTEQKDLFTQVGATRFLTGKEDLHSEYDYVVEAAGAIAAVSLALSHAKRGGKILLLGYPEHSALLQVSVHDLINNDLTIHASFSYSRDSWKEIVVRLNSGQLNLTPLVTHHFTLDKWQEAIQTLRHAGKNARGKVLLKLKTD